jgi:hypothetical protein
MKWLLYRSKLTWLNDVSAWHTPIALSTLIPPADAELVKADIQK